MTYFRNIPKSVWKMIIKLTVSVETSKIYVTPSQHTTYLNNGINEHTFIVPRRRTCSEIPVNLLLDTWKEVPFIEESNRR